MYTVYLWLAGKRVVDFLLAIIEFFSLALTAAALKGGGHFKRTFQRDGGGHPPTNFGIRKLQSFWHQKTTVPGLSRGVVCVILRLAVLIQYRRVTHTQTHRHTDGHAMMAITRA